MTNYPSDWLKDEVINIVDFHDNFRVPVSQYLRPRGSTPYYGANGIQDYISGYTHEGEFVLIAEDGANSLSDYPINYTEGKIWVNNHAHVLTGKTYIINSKFLSYALKMVDYKKVIVGGTRKKLNGATLKKIVLYYPEFKEQEKIAKSLSSFDTHIDNLSKLIEKKKMIRDGAVEELVSGKRRLDGFDGEWVTYKFKKYFRKIPNNTLARDELDKKGCIGSIHYGDILTLYGTVLESDYDIPRLKDISWFSENKALKIHDVIIADTAEDETVGKVVQIGEVDVPLVSGLHTVACRPNYETAYGFLGYYMNSNTFHQQLIPFITGIKVSSISKKALDELKLCLPNDIKEQQAIADILSAMDREIESLEKEKEKYKSLKAGAMDDLLTGRVRLV